MAYKKLTMLIRGKRVCCLLILALLFFTFTTISSQITGESSARFLVISDMGGSASPNQKAVAAAMAKEADNIGAQFVVTIGDNYHVDGIERADSPRWKTEFEDVYDYPSLQIPWYPSLGNHDYRGSVEAEIEYSKLSQRWKLPSRYYTQTERIDDSNSVMIVHLDTSPFIEKYSLDLSVYHLEEQNPVRQLVWLDSVLTDSKARWKIVAGHHSIYAAASGHGDTKELIENILPILKKHAVPLYLCGHYHILQHIQKDNTNFVICGAGMEFGTADRGDDVVFGAGSLGFLSVSVSVKEIDLKIIDEKNKVLHSIRIK